MGSPMTNRIALNLHVWRAGLLTALLCVLAWPAQAIAGVVEDRDHDSREQLLKSSPSAAELVKRGEHLLNSGHPIEAAALLAQATKIEPQNALVARVECRVHTELRDAEAATMACRRALAHELTQKDWPADMLAMVRALLSAKQGPTTEQLYQAISIASSLMRKVSNQPWPYLAQCEIATRLGNVNASRLCDPKLSAWAQANAHYDPAASASTIRRARGFMWSAWLALAGICVATLLHALRAKKLEKRMLKTLTTAAIVSVLAISLVPSLALGEAGGVPKPGDMGTMPINEEDPESSVPSPQQRDRNPIGYAYFVMDISSRAEKATKNGDHKQAALYYRALVKAVPNKSVGYSKLCASYEELQDWPNALANCRTALAYDGVKDADYGKYAHLLMDHTPKLSTSEVQDIDAIVKQLRAEEPKGGVADLVECEVGVKLHDQVRLQRCTANLAVLGPTDPKTLSFEWAYAVERGDYNQARSLIEQLRQTTISQRALKRMEDATRLALPLWKRALTNTWLLVVGVGGIIVALAFTFLGKRQPQQTVAAK